MSDKNNGYTVFENIYKSINQFINESTKDNVVIVIDGMCCSGKTTLGKYLESKMDIRLIHADHFFLPVELRTEERYKEPGGNIHYERMKEEVIEHLGGDISYGVFNCSVQKVETKKDLPFKKVTILEGTYSLNPYFGKYYDYALFLKVKEETQKQRILDRVPKERIKMFETKWIPFEKMYFDKLNIEAKCDKVYYTDQ